MAARYLGLNSPFITAAGYAMNWRDCVEYMMYGCNAIQVNRAIMAHGPEVITRINRDLEKYLDEKGYTNVSELRGMALPHLLPSHRDINALYGQTKGQITAEVIPGRCNRCRICEKTCPYFAITVAGEEPLIDAELCEGCGLCVANCPREALKMKNIDMIYNLNTSSN